MVSLSTQSVTSIRSSHTGLNSPFMHFNRDGREAGQRIFRTDLIPQGACILTMPRTSSFEMLEICCLR